MNIAMICSEYPPVRHGGIGTVAQMLGRALVRQGHGVRVVGIKHPHDPESEYEEDQGVRVWRLPQSTGHGGWLMGRWRLYKTIQRWSRDGIIDLVEVPDWQGMIARWPRLPVPVVMRLNGSMTYFARELDRSLGWLMRRIELSAWRRADFTCSCSRYTADQSRALFGASLREIDVLYNGVEVVPMASEVREREKVVFTGTLTEKKGVISLMIAWPLVLRECPWARLHLYGKDTVSSQGGSMRATLEEMARGVLPDQVVFHGHVARSQVFEALSTARVAVFPSYAEAFAMAPLEAMTTGCPTIYSSRGSGPELLEHGKEGLLVDPGDPTDIANAIIRVLKDEALAVRLGGQGRARVQSAFSMEQTLAANIVFFEKCLKQFHS